MNLILLHISLPWIMNEPLEPQKVLALIWSLPFILGEVQGNTEPPLPGHYLCRKERKNQVSGRDSKKAEEIYWISVWKSSLPQSEILSHVTSENQYENKYITKTRDRGKLAPLFKTGLGSPLSRAQTRGTKDFNIFI